MKIKVDIIPQEIVEQYNLDKLTSSGWISIEIQKGVYGLLQTGILLNDKLKAHLVDITS